MVANMTDIQTGMDVYGTDGEKIGTIAQVYPMTSSGERPSPGGFVSGDVSVGDVRTDEVEVMPRATGMMGTPDVETVPRGTDESVLDAPGYVQVDRGGILGIGTQHLYIPFSALTDVVPGENVTVNCTKDQCGERFGTMPKFLDREGSSAPLT